VGAVVKILDLGTGRALFEEGEGPQFDLTRPGEMLGASDYMAPEQAKDAHNIDIRADIYSLGCVLYHALAWQPPFADTSPVRQLVRHATEAPRPIAEHNPQVPDGLQQVLNWMLAKSPDQRYPTPARAAAALEVFLAAGSAAALPTNTQLNEYMEWVETLDGAGPIPVPGQARPATTARKTTAPPPPPAPARPAPARKEAEEELMEINVEPVDLDVPAPRPKAPPPPRPERKASRQARSDRDDEKPARSRRKAKREEEEEEEEEPARILGLRPRELAVLTFSLLGLFVLGVLGVIGWVIYKVVS
jgi:serine/threonine protein kinase